jgi:transposase
VAQEGLSFEEAGRRFGVGKQTIYRWSKSIEPKLTRNKNPLKIDNACLRADVEKYPDAYQKERAQRLGVSRRGIGWALKRLGFSYKKNSKAS